MGLEEGPGCSGDICSLLWLNPALPRSLMALPHELGGRTSLEGQVGVSDNLPLQEGAATHGVARPSGVAAVAHGDHPCTHSTTGTVPRCRAGSHPKQLQVPAAEQDVENIKEGNKTKQKETCPHPTSPQSAPKEPLEMPDTRHWQAGNILHPRRISPGSLSLSVAEDSKPALPGEAEAADTGLRGATIGPGCDNGVADTAICQPAGTAAVQPRELPGGVELPHPGDLGPCILAALLGLLQRHPSQAVQVENLS